jgi:hypothetical protein
MENNFFNELASMNVSDFIEKKGKFSYVSWSNAIDILKRKCPDATWTVVRHDGKPYIDTPLGYFVEVELTCNGVTQSHIHPILDNQNKPIQKPNAFQVNTSIQRCLVKCIAVTTGLGLYVYNGEDLPFDGETSHEKEEKEREKLIGKIDWLVKEIGTRGVDMLLDLEEKAKVNIAGMNTNLLKRVVSLLEKEKKEKKVPLQVVDKPLEESTKEPVNSD